MKRNLLILSGLLYVSSALADDKDLFSQWMGENNEGMIDLSRCDIVRNSRITYGSCYKCLWSFKTPEGNSCETQAIINLDNDPRSKDYFLDEGLFFIDLLRDSTKETCGQKYYGQYGTFKKIDDTLLIFSISEYFEDKIQMHIFK